MRHRKAGNKLGRNPSHRRALLRNLVTSVLIEDRVETTLAKAKAAGAMILTGPYAAGARQAAIVQFPGGYIAEIHAAARP